MFVSKFGEIKNFLHSSHIIHKLEFRFNLSSSNISTFKTGLKLCVHYYYILYIIILVFIIITSHFLIYQIIILAVFLT